MDFIISLLLFFIALGVLVTIHELGHFIAAKSFNVFCSEFSIGFGPKIIKYKRKKGETKFCVGIIPLGGYVRMYGEESDDEDKDSPDYVDVPRERSLVGIKRWKRIIIMSAGIIMNFILAYIIFFISAVSSPQLTNDPTVNVVSILDEETFDENFKNNEGNLLTLEEKEFIEQSFINFNTYQYTYTYKDVSGNEHVQTVTLSNVGNAQNTTVNGESSDVVYLLDTSNYGYNDTDYSKCFKFYEGFTMDSIPSEISDIKVLDGENFIDVPSESNFVIPLIAPTNNGYEFVGVNENQMMDINLDILFSKYINDGTDVESQLFNVTFHKDSLNNYSSLGLGMYAKFEWLGWDAFGYAGKKWVDSTTLIADAIGQLFYKAESWSNIGGPIAIFTQTTQILNNYPFSFYLETWGMISVNLALFNLLPFPGLDGWQILVEIVEGSVNLVKKGIWASKQKRRKGDEPVLEGNINETNNEVILENNEDKESVSSLVTPVENSDNIEENSNKEVGDVSLKEEKYKEWEIPPKVKNIMSAIGLILLFALMFVIIIKDIVSLF